MAAGFTPALSFPHMSWGMVVALLGLLNLGGPRGEVQNRGRQWHLLSVCRTRWRDSNTRKAMRPQSAGAEKFGKSLGIIITGMKAAASLRS